MPSTRALIRAPWSASKVATALRCPRLFFFRYVEKIPEPEVSPEARIGKAIHAALELALQGTPVPSRVQQPIVDPDNGTPLLGADVVLNAGEAMSCLVISKEGA